MKRDRTELFPETPLLVPIILLRSHLARVRGRSRAASKQGINERRYRDGRSLRLRHENDEERQNRYRWDKPPPQSLSEEIIQGAQNQRKRRARPFPLSECSTCANCLRVARSPGNQRRLCDRD